MTKTTLALLASLTLVLHVEALVHKAPLRSVASLKETLVREGKWKEWTDRVANANANGSLWHRYRLYSGTTPMPDYGNTAYLIDITLGSPAQKFQLQFDTGSSNTWVIDQACNSNPCVGYSGYYKNRFNPSQSSSFTNVGTSFEITYGSGWASGTIATDDFVVGLDTVTFKLDGQGFALVESVSPDFQYAPFDGIFGAAWPSLAVDGVSPPIQNLLGFLDEPLFTVWLEKTNSGTGGEITFGAYDTTHCSDVYYVTALTSASYWQFGIDNFRVGGYEFSGFQQVISDTGTSFLTGPDSQVNAIVAATGAEYDFSSDYYVIQCDAQGLPDLVFDIGGHGFNVPSSDYTLDFGLGNNKCVLAVSSFTVGDISWIFGDTFGRAFCTVYNIGAQQIGFATAN